MNWYLEVLKKYFVFSGRARRKEYWYFVLFNIIAFVVLINIDQAINIPEVSIIFQVFSIGIIIPGFAVAVRRLHDIGKSGWFLFIIFIPFGSIWLIFSLATAGVNGPNKYGPDPKNTDGLSSSSVLDDNI